MHRRGRSVDAFLKHAKIHRGGIPEDAVLLVQRAPFRLEEAGCWFEPVSCFIEPVACWFEPVGCFIEPVGCFIEPVRCWIEPAQCLFEPAACPAWVHFTLSEAVRVS